MSTSDPTSADDRPLVLTGMHRSGTSLVARLFQAAGVDLGKELLRPDPHNPEGHFEDREFVDFHSGVLAARDPSRLILWCPPDAIGWTRGERERAAELAASRRGLGVWGWKDPRTVLFLEEWRELLPEACFLLVVRDPAEVVDSLRRRQDRQLVVRALGRTLMLGGRRRGFFRYGRAIEAWRRYNARLLRFASAHPARCRVLDLAEIVRDPEAAIRSVRERFGLPIAPVSWRDVFVPHLLRREPQRRVAARVARRSEVRELYAALRQQGSLG